MWRAGRPGRTSLSTHETKTPTVRVQKRDWRGNVRHVWQGVVLAQDAESLLLEAVWEGPGEPAVGELRFERGDRFLEYYFVGKSYAIWRIERPTGALKGWYCNISRPLRMEEGMLSFDDLLLDVLVYPDGRCVVLDRDELEQARHSGLSEADTRVAESALDAVLDLILHQHPPFAFSHAPRAVEDDR